MTGAYICALVTGALGVGLALAAPGGPASAAPGGSLIAQGSVDTAGSIQRAVDALPATGGTIRLRAGTYLLARGSLSGSTYPTGRPIRSAVVIKGNHVRIEGTRGRTILELAPGTKMRAITISGHDDTLAGLSFEGDGRRRNPGRGWPSGDVVDALVYASDARDVTVSRCNISGGIEDAIGAFRTDGITVRENTIHDNGTDVAGSVGIAFTHTTDAVASGNVIDRNSAAGISVDRTSSAVRITANRIEGNAKEGIIVAGTGVTVSANEVNANGAKHYAAISVYGARATAVTANTVVANRFTGIAVANGTGGPASGITLRGNTVTGNGSNLADQIHIEPGEGVNSNWNSANTVRFDQPALWWPLGSETR
jgi:hypothetical protein